MEPRPKKKNVSTSKPKARRNGAAAEFDPWALHPTQDAPRRERISRKPGDNDAAVAALREHWHHCFNAQATEAAFTTKDGTRSRAT